MCSTCKGFHPTSLHTNVPKPKGKPGTSPKNSSMDVMSHHVNTHKPGDGGFCDSHSLIVPVWLYQRGYPEKKELVYTLLDNQSDACFVTEEILQKLQPVAKMLRHLTRKTLFLPKHRIKSHISKIKQLPSPSPIFNVVLRKFQHDLLL